jgi:hypothetical protein
MCADIGRAISLLVHGLGSIFTIPLAKINIGGRKTRSCFWPAFEVLVQHSTTGYSILAEGRSRKIVFCPIFLVKKDATSSRFIFDGREVNKLCRTPPPVALPAMDDLLKKLNTMTEADTKWSFVLCDFRHWFHQIKLPPRHQLGTGSQNQRPAETAPLLCIPNLANGDYRGPPSRQRHPPG